MNKEKRRYAVAQAVYELMNIEEHPEVQPWEDAEEEDRFAALTIADSLILLADSLLLVRKKA